MNDKRLFDILNVVEKESNNNIIIPIYKILNENYQKRWGLNGKQKNNEYFDIGKSYIDLKEGLEFEIIFPGGNPRNYQRSKSKLIGLRNARAEKVDIIQNGEEALALIEFINSNPELLSKLHTSDQQFNKQINEFLFLTTQPVMDRILELYER